MRVWVTRSQNTTTRRNVARFCDNGRHRYSQMSLDSQKASWLTEVCFAVSGRLVMGAGDGDDQEWKRDDGRKMQKRRRGTTSVGKLRREKACRKGWQRWVLLAVERVCEMQPSTHQTCFAGKSCMELLVENWVRARSGGHWVDSDRGRHAGTLM